MQPASLDCWVTAVHSRTNDPHLRSSRVAKARQGFLRSLNFTIQRHWLCPPMCHQVPRWEYEVRKATGQLSASSPRPTESQQTGSRPDRARCLQRLNVVEPILSSPRPVGALDWALFGGKKCAQRDTVPPTLAGGKAAAARRSGVFHVKRRLLAATGSSAHPWTRRSAPKRISWSADICGNSTVGAVRVPLP